MSKTEPMSAVVERLEQAIESRETYLEERGWLDSDMNVDRADLARLLSDHKAQRELLTDATQALQPFAAIANIYDGGWVKDDTATTGFSSKLSIRQARNARAAHARLKAEEEGAE